MYLLILAIGMCGVYAALLVMLPLFFNQPIRLNARRAGYSLGIVILSSIVAFSMSGLPADPWWQNRLLHSVGGGALAFLTFFLAAKDCAVRFSRFQFFALGFLVVTALGVGNELLEFFAQTYLPLTFARTVEDTWLDLVSNTAGSLITGTLLTLFLAPKPENKE